MRVSRNGVGALLLLVLTVPLLTQATQNAPNGSGEQSSQQAGAQTSPQTPAESAQPTPPAARSVGRARQAPCWMEAGISPAGVNQRWQIENNAKGKINEVCSDVSLTAEQKRGKIRQIDERTEQEIAKIIPATQLEAFKVCQAEREKTKRPGGTAQKELGPCGGVIPAQPQPGAPRHSHEDQTH